MQIFSLHWVMKNIRLCNVCDAQSKKKCLFNLMLHIPDIFNHVGTGCIAQGHNTVIPLGASPELATI